MPLGFGVGFGLGSLLGDRTGHVLSDRELWDEISYTEFDVYPLDVEQVQPASIDLRLGGDFYRLVDDLDKEPIDTKKSTDQRMRHRISDEITIQPGECVLGTTFEYINLPANLLGEIEGRSSMGRLFIEVHKTAGIIDPGFSGEITLELMNSNPRPVTLYSGQRVCQMVVHKLNRPAENPYGQKGDSKYQGQSGATRSGLHKDR